MAGKQQSVLQRAGHYGAKQVQEIFENLKQDNLWKRILKNVIATTAAASICLIPGAKAALGRAAYLAPITTVFGHPGRRFGMMAEALVLALGGTLFGVAWSSLGIYLGSLVFHSSPPAAYAIRGVFLAVAMMVHGFLRSGTPRLFILVLLLIIVSVVSLVSTATALTPVLVTQILYPILMAAGVILIVNLCVFPEFSSSFLGQMTIETLNDTAKALEDAGHYFTYTNQQSEGNSVLEPQLPQETYLTPTNKLDGPRSQDYRPLNVSKDLERTTQTTPKKHKRVENSEASNPNISGTKELLRAPNPSDKETVKSLSALAMAKGKLRTKLASCKAAQRECNFEVAISVLPPRSMKPISVSSMKRLVANTVALIGACESRYALLGDLDRGNEEPDSRSLRQNNSSNIKSEKLRGKDDEPKNHGQNITSGRAELDLIKPRREIEFGDVELLRYLLDTVTNPYLDLQAVITRMVGVISACIAYTYDVPKLPSGAQVPKGIVIEELDVHIQNLQQALITFDGDTASALEKAAVMQELKDQEPDIMPREEIFLVSSFLLNLRQAASHLETMLKHSRDLVLQREHRHGRRTIYAPHIHWATWLYSGGGEDEALPISGRKANRQGTTDEDADDEDGTPVSGSKESLLTANKKGDLEKTAGLDDGLGDLEMRPQPQISHKTTNLSEPTHELKSPVLRVRAYFADSLEWLQGSDDFLYAIKITFAVFLVVWPALIASWNTWYSLNRGLWAALQLVLITEVSIGSSVRTFVVRAIGTTLGCLWGWAAWEARKGNAIVCAVMMCIGIIPSAYVQLGTVYPKAGMVSIISMAVVALSTELATVPGTATENFLKRWIAFMIGGAVALVVEVILLPVKARSRLVESLAAALRQINEMETCIALGIEQGVNLDVYAPDIILRFEKASGKANGALSAAETFLPFCSTEPRIKGSFQGLAMIYEEIIFVLRQIVDRMDNMLQLRTAYGSGPLEEFNAQIYPYRRNVAGSITLTLFAIHGALTTKLPLPQYFPSARLAHLRMINRVREVVQQAGKGGEHLEDTSKLAHQRAVHRKYISWNAASAAQAEVIEFLEELIDLSKLLVGANEFRTGLLTRPAYHQYGERMEDGDKGVDAEEQSEARDEVKETPLNKQGLNRRRRGTTISSHDSNQEIPASLRRIQSRKIEDGIRRQRTNDSWNQDSH